MCVDRVGVARNQAAALGVWLKCASLLVDKMYPEQPVRQWVFSVLYPLRFQIASRLPLVGRVFGTVYYCIITGLFTKAGFSREVATRN